MTTEVSIWRWQLEGDLEAQFAALVAADADRFAVVAAQIAGEQDLPDLAETQAETEARIRAMGLPDDVLQTTLEGFRAMVAEAEEEQAALNDVPADDRGAYNGEGHIGAALASSHMFYNDPHASLEHKEIDTQVMQLLERYKAAMAKVLGDTGQSFTGYLGVTSDQFCSDAVFDLQTQAGLEGAVWIWETGDAGYVLSHWQENKELPIDLELYRFPLAALEAFRQKLSG